MTKNQINRRLRYYRQAIVQDTKAILMLDLRSMGGRHDSYCFLNRIDCHNANIKKLEGICQP